MKRAAIAAAAALLVIAASSFAWMRARTARGRAVVERCKTLKPGITLDEVRRVMRQEGAALDAWKDKASLRFEVPSDFSVYPEVTYVVKTGVVVKIVCDEDHVVPPGRAGWD